MFDILLFGGLAAVADIAGGLIALWRKPTSLFMSVALGFGAGVILAVLSFEMVPEALKAASLIVLAIGFSAGFAAFYAVDLLVHRGRVAGEHAEQHELIEKYHKSRGKRGGQTTVLGVGIVSEALIEGLSIGLGTVALGGAGIVIAGAIAIENVSENLSLGELLRSESEENILRRVLIWSGVGACTHFGGAVVAWLLLRGAGDIVLGALFAVGAGGMLYLAVTQLIPEAESRHYEQSSAVATALGFLAILILAHLA